MDELIDFDLDVRNWADKFKDGNKDCFLYIRGQEGENNNMKISANVRGNGILLADMIACFMNDNEDMAEVIITAVNAYLEKVL